jgi:2'-5' RNA ligase
MTTDPAQMADHWWWRPGWSVGRRFYTWHITFEHSPNVHRLAATYRQALAGLPALDLVPDQWLHLTMQGLGFVDQVPEPDARAVVDAAAARLAQIPSFDITIDRPQVTPEAIRWEADPTQPVAEVRSAIRAAIADVWPSVPEQADGFRPHVSIAYSAGDVPARPVLETIATVPSSPATTRIGSAELIVLHRDKRMYEWETFASIPLSP